jgi:type IV pilus biogenesis protein CpaD/CtpE
VVHGVDRLAQGARQHVRAFAVMLQQMECHALRRFRPDAGQAAQRFGQQFQRLGVLRMAS